MPCMGCRHNISRLDHSVDRAFSPSSGRHDRALLSGSSWRHPETEVRAEEPLRVSHKSSPCPSVPLSAAIGRFAFLGGAS